MTNAQNQEFYFDPRRLEAAEEVNGLVGKIKDRLDFDGTAGYYLTVLPPLLNQLEAAVEKLSIVEATVEAEILGKERYHG